MSCSVFRTHDHLLSGKVKFGKQNVNEPRNIIGPVVRQIREQQNLTQAMLVAKLNLKGWDISRETLAKLEAQIRWIADFEIIPLAKGLGLEPTELLRRAIQASTKLKKQPPAA